ncbi:MAG: M23 family metallopeptidase [Patescibacteria group bacterium]
MRITNLKLVAVGIIVFIIFGIYLIINPKPIIQSNNYNNSTTQTSKPLTPVVTATPDLPATKNPAITQPINDALTRVTKKPFGIYVSPKSSPTMPERFTGYHTGVDFETTAAEQNQDVTIYAICPGPLVLKKYASGYGGVAVQQCQIQSQAVTVIYGHLKLSSISISQNEELKAGQQIGILGQGYSTETDGERKHLHLGIHLGKTITLLGYVQNQNDFKQWLDLATLLK